MRYKGREGARRTLRFGAAGADVRSLQEFLRLQGYDLGEEEQYGYLTKDAVRQFQRDHGLRVDGIAGPRFFDLISQKDLPFRRRVHLVQPEETLEEISAKYGLGPQAFGYSNRVRQIYPGRRLVFFDREVWALSSKPVSQLPQNPLTGLIVISKEHCLGNISCIQKTKLGLTNGVLKIHELFRTRRQRKATIEKMLLEMAGCGGLYLPWRELLPLDGRRYLSFLKGLRRRLGPKELLFVELGPGIPQWRVTGGLDYGRVNSLADRLVLTMPISSRPEALLNREKAELLLNSLGPKVYPWKILLRLPVFAVEWEIFQDGDKWIKLSYAAALSRAFRFGARLEQDQTGALFYSFRRQAGLFQIRLPQYNLMGDVLALVNLYNLAGVILDSLGLEDPRLWNVLGSYFRAARL